MALGETLAGYEAALIGLVDGWEHLLSDQKLSEGDARAFAKGRCAALAAVFDAGEASPGAARGIEAASHTWAYADLAAKVSQQADRDLLISLGLDEVAAGTKLPARRAEFRSWPPSVNAP